MLRGRIPRMCAWLGSTRWAFPMLTPAPRFTVRICPIKLLVEGLPCGILPASPASGTSLTSFQRGFPLSSHSHRALMTLIELPWCGFPRDLMEKSLDLPGSHWAAFPSSLHTQGLLWVFLSVHWFQLCTELLSVPILPFDFMLCISCLRNPGLNWGPFDNLISWSIMVDGSWNSPEWQFASFPFALLSHWSRKVIYSTMTLVQSAAIQPCWFIWAIPREVLPCSGSAGAHEFRVDFYCCPWVVKGFSYYNQIFCCCVPWVMLNWVIQLCLEDAWVEVDTAIWEWGSCSDFKTCSIIFAVLVLLLPQDHYKQV